MRPICSWPPPAPGTSCGGAPSSAIPDPLYYYVVREGSITRNSSTGRNLEIIDAVRGIVEWYRQTGRFARFQPELEAVAVKHVLLTASVRVLRIDPGSPVLKELADYVSGTFPRWRENPYVRAFPAKHRLILALLRARQYRLIRMIFSVKDR